MLKPGRIVQLTVLSFTLVSMAFPRQDVVASSDPFQQHVAGLVLSEQSIVDGVAMLSRSTGLAVSVEFPLGVTISGPAPPLKTITVNIGPGTVAEVLDRLCALDSTFTWTRNGDILHVLPRISAKDPTYVLNKKADELRFQDVQEASDAIMKMVGQLRGPREQIAVLQVGTALNFARPWSATLKDVTVREAVDQIAQQLGSAYGWQFSGAQDFRMVTFHEGLLPKPSRSKQDQNRTPK